MCCASELEGESCMKRLTLTATASAAALLLLASACSKPESKADNTGGLSGAPITIGVQSLETSALGMVTALHEDGAKTAALAVTDSPSSHGYVDKLVAPLGQQLGVSVSAVYTTADSANFQVLAQTELASKPDVAGLIALPE